MKRTKSHFITITIRCDDIDLQLITDSRKELTSKFDLQNPKFFLLEKIIFLCSGAKRLLACESCRSRSGCRGSIVLPGDSLFLQGHAANCSGQKEQSGVPGAWGRAFFQAANLRPRQQRDYDSMAANSRVHFSPTQQIWIKQTEQFVVLFSQVGLHKFLPRSVLNGMKPKALRKLIQQHFKKVAALSELECMFKFFDLLRAHYRFDQERFICALGVSSKIDVIIYLAFL